MSPIAVPMVPQGGRVLVAEWWRVECAEEIPRDGTLRNDLRADLSRLSETCSSLAEARRRKKRREAKGVTLGWKCRIVHVRRYKLNGKVK